jgi:hypothetical protein
MVVASSGILLHGSPVTANVLVAQCDSPTDFEYQIAQMPDLDQKRNGLPNFGKMYCVPTSSLNMLFYAANHGFPEITPGPVSWQSPSTYLAAGLALLAMGSPAYMDTDPEDGESLGGALTGIKTWLGNDSKLIASLSYPSDTWSPTLQNLGYHGVTGALVGFCYGRYTILAGGLGGMTVGTRNGGHCVTLSRAARDGSSMEIWSRDPGHDEEDFGLPLEWDAQSLFTSRTYEVDNIDCWFGGDVQRIMTALDYSLIQDGQVRLIDGLIVIRPKFGYHFTTLAELVVLLPSGGFVDPSGPDEQTIVMPTGTTLLDTALHPDLGTYAALAGGAGGPTGGAPSILRIDPLEGTSQTIATLSGATHLTFGRRRDLYVLAGSTLYRVNLDVEPAAVSSVTLIAPGDALAYDDARDEVVVVSVSQRKIMRYPHTLITEVVLTDVIPAVLPFTGPIDVAVPPSSGPTDPASGKLYIARDDGNLVLAFSGGAVTGEPLTWETITHPTIAHPKSIDVDDNGALYINSNGTLVVMWQDAAGGWQPDAESPFAGQSVGGRFRIARSRTNFDPFIHDGPGWHNFDPDTEPVVGEAIPDCIADLNLDGIVNGLDLALLLSEWGAKDSAADLNFDGTVSGLDLALLLGAWGPCAS